MIAFDQEQSDNVIAMPTKSNEWYTPSRYIEAAREVMGSIDLDPASCKEANMVVRASKFYTQHDNGLLQPWYGNVWLNPPYGTGKPSGYASNGKSNIAQFLTKLITEYEDEKVIEAIALVRADPSAYWFSLLWEYLICFQCKNFYFDSPHGKVKHQFGSCFVYLGSNEQKFIDIFSKFGPVAKRVSMPKVRPVPLPLWESS